MDIFEYLGGFCPPSSLRGEVRDLGLLSLPSPENFTLEIIFHYYVETLAFISIKNKNSLHTQTHTHTHTQTHRHSLLYIY